MKNKNIKNYLFGLCVVGSGAMMTSCNDFLDVLPMNEVVLENYWTKKSDVTSALMGCYESLQAGESVTRMGLWGEYIIARSGADAQGEHTANKQLL